ncbi:MAG TPA: serine/threonine-protein kinase, partial [Gemmataceae bacterium]|nr:serine/threonine-protein kinase [Gemmataceae bacterium]
GQNMAALVGELRRAEAPAGASGDLRSAGGPGTSTRPNLGAQLSTQRSGRAGDFFRTVARLAAQVAEALDYAHGMGVVHRDIKPANLLVDYRGSVWVTDFGLAQFQADAGLTQSGDLLGTLRYMSPEQAGGQRVVIDHRTDVYSLGATLYELLTLRPIFDGADRQTLLHQIVNEEPLPPRAADRSVPPELETIVLKAVAKAPADRYATTREFADDLHRFLRHEPILARRPTLVQRARKWLRRHPSVPVAAGLMLVLLAAGSLVSAWLIGIEQSKTKRAYEEERRRAEEAEKQFLLARGSVDYLIQIAESEIADHPFLQGLRRRLLEAALEYYDQFIEQHREDPTAQAQLEATKERVKKIVADLAVLQGAGQLFLLTEESVLDDLRLSEEQRRRITDLSGRLDEQRQQSFAGFHRLAEEERRQRFLELARQNKAAVAEILSPEKLSRLRRIELQRQGLGAFRDPDVVGALKLTGEQRDRIRTIEDEVFRRPDGVRPGPPQGGPQFWQAREEAMRKALERIQKTVLTEEQAKQWKEMTGEPFKAAFTPPGPFGPGGPPRGGPGGPPR